MAHEITLATGAGQLLVTGLAQDELERLQQDWSRSLSDASTGESRTLDRAGSDWENFQEQVVYSATQQTITSSRGAAIMFHGAALADPTTGDTVALVAASGTGKTTATRVLGQQLGYLTDETVVVDPRSRVITPFPKPLSILGPSGRRPKTQYGPDGLGLLPAPQSARLTAICVLDRDPGHQGPPAAECLSAAKALALVLPQSSSLASLDRGLVQMCQLFDAVGGVHRLRYAESAELLPLVTDLLRGQTPPPHSPDGWVPAPSELLSPAQQDPAADTPTGAVRRIGVDDAVELADGSLALLHGERYSVIHGIGPALWELTGDWTTSEQLITELTQGADAPPNAAELIDQAISAMVQDHLLERA